MCHYRLYGVLWDLKMAQSSIHCEMYCKSPIGKIFFYCLCILGQNIYLRVSLWKSVSSSYMKCIFCCSVFCGFHYGVWFFIFCEFVNKTLVRIGVFCFFANIMVDSFIECGARSEDGSCFLCRFYWVWYFLWVCEKIISMCVFCFCCEKYILI